MGCPQIMSHSNAAAIQSCERFVLLPDSPFYTLEVCKATATKSKAIEKKRICTYLNIICEG